MGYSSQTEFPYVNYNLTDGSGFLECVDDPMVENVASITSEVRLINQAVNWDAYLNTETKSDDKPYEVDLITQQSFVTNTTSVININLMQQDVQVGQSRVYNGDKLTNFKRDELVTFRHKDTTYNFDYNRGAQALGNKIVYSTYNFQLANYKGITIVDLYLTLPMAMARLGGFIFFWYIICWLLLALWMQFNADNESILFLSTFSQPVIEGLDEKR